MNPETILCSQCGADTEAPRRFARLVVCPYCRSTLLVRGDRLELRGVQAVLAEADGPLFVGETGGLEGRPFEVLGRLRYRTAGATWDEWFVRLDDEPVWISEEEGEYKLTRHQEGAAPGVRPESLRPGSWIDLAGTAWVVLETGRATLAGMEGAVPLEYETAHEYPYADLQGGGGEAATLERHTGGWVLFTGRVIELSSMRFDHTVFED